MSSEQLRLQLYLAHRSALVAYATPIVGSRSSAEDVVQEAFLRFVPDMPERTVAQPVSYLYRIVRNLSLDWTRQFASENRRKIEHLVHIDTVGAVPSPEDTALYRDELRRVGAALAALPEPTRTAFEMYRFGDARLEEIAQRLGISVSSAHRLVRDALMRCSREIADKSE